MKHLKNVAILNSIIFSLSGIAAPVGNFKYGTLMGYAPKGVIENSGMGYSRDFHHIFYVNDGSPRGPSKAEFFVSEFSGELIEKVLVQGARNKDIEGFSTGPCGDGGRCLFLADIGDNSESRGAYTIYVVKEKAFFGGEAELFSQITFTHPYQKSANHEGLAVHPITGDIFILTKNYDGPLQELYKIPASRWQGKGNHQVETQLVGEINLAELSPELKGRLAPATALSISPSGRRFIILSGVVKKAWEFEFDLSKDSYSFKSLASRAREVRIDPLGQEESLEYLDEDTFFYSSEGSHMPLVMVPLFR